MKSFSFTVGMLVMVALLTPLHLTAAPRTEVIPLNYGLAENLLPAIQPLLRPDERASAYGNQLIIRAEPERLQEIRVLLDDLDRRPARLRISVANAGSSSGSQRGYRLDGRIRTGAGDLEIGHPGRGSQARIIRRETTGSEDGVRTIMANEGYPVLIQSGQSIPLESTTSTIHGQVMQQTQYHDVTSGFYATVRLNGDRATITLSTNHDRTRAAGNDVIDVQRTDTVVTAPLGEWVTIGGVDDLASGQSRDIGRRITTGSTTQQSIRVMVERLD